LAPNSLRKGELCKPEESQHKKSLAIDLRRGTDEENQSVLLEEGSQYRGTVTSLETFGAFVRLDGAKATPSYTTARSRIFS